MGILDSVFGGRGGLVDVLSQTLGGTATVRVATGSTRDATTGKLTPTFVDYVVSFIPGAAAQNSGASSVPENEGGALQRVATEISGTFPASQIGAVPRAGRDLLRVGAVDYRITAVDAVRVGDAVVQFRVNGTRLN